MHRNITIVTSLLLVLGTLTTALEGPNVCRENKIVTVEKDEIVYVKREETIRGWCLEIPPRCPKIKIVLHPEKKTILRNQTKVVESCCSDFTEVNGKCVSCSDPSVDCSNSDGAVAASARVDDESHQNFSTLNYLLILFGVLLFVGICLLAIYYRRKFVELKELLYQEYLKYMAAEDDPRHFDNPTYGNNKENNLKVTNLSLDLTGGLEKKGIKDVEAEGRGEVPRNGNLYVEVDGKGSIKTLGHIYQTIDEVKAGVNDKTIKANNDPNLILPAKSTAKDLPNFLNNNLTSGAANNDYDIPKPQPDALYANVVTGDEVKKD